MIKLVMKPAWLAVAVFIFSPLFADEQEDLAAALAHAIKNEDIAAATSLLETGADPNGFSSSNQETSLILAVRRGNVQLTKLLLDYGADPNVISSWGWSAAHYAEGRNSAEILRLLASGGARFDVASERGNSPLMEHINRSRNIEGIIFLLDWEEEHSPGFTAGFNNRKEYYTSLLALLLDKNQRDAEKYLLAERLLNSGADAAAKNSNGTPIVFSAVSYSNLRSGLLPLLVERGAPVNEFDRYDATLLMCAAENKADHLVSFLLDHGADPNIQNEKGKTALMNARTVVTAKHILAAGADPNLQDKDGETALFHAWLHPQIIIPLLEGGADASHTDLRGNTALHNWMYIPNVNALEALLSYGCPLDQPNHAGITPLMKAARIGKGKAVLLLLDKGADATRRDNSGTSVILYYLTSRNIEKVYSYQGNVETGSYLIDDDKEKLETVVAALLAAGANPADTNNDGNSALIYVMTESKSKYGAPKYLVLLRDMMLKYTVKDDVKIAKAVINKKNRAEFKENLPAYIAALSLPLIVGGLSIGMREGVYADNKSANWMGPVNGYLTLSTSGFFFGGLLGIAFSGDRGLGALGGGFLGCTLGLIGGIVIASMPGVQETFTNFPGIYYLPTALSILGAGIIIYKISY